MGRSVDEKARFRGNDELYRNNYDNIKGFRKENGNEEAERDSSIVPTDGINGGDSDQNDDRVRPEHAEG